MHARIFTHRRAKIAAQHTRCSAKRVSPRVVATSDFRRIIWCRARDTSMRVTSPDMCGRDAGVETVAFRLICKYAYAHTYRQREASMCTMPCPRGQRASYWKVQTRHRMCAHCALRLFKSNDHCPFRNCSTWGRWPIAVCVHEVYWNSVGRWRRGISRTPRVRTVIYRSRTVRDVIDNRNAVALSERTFGSPTGALLTFEAIITGIYVL